MLKTDIIIVTYNRRHLLEQTINGIKERTRMPYRLIIVDNYSIEDDTKDYLQELNKKQEIENIVIFNDTNKGLAPGYNIGFKYVKSELFITTNDDLIPPDLEPDWLQRLIVLFNKYYPEYGAIALRCARLKGVRFESPWVPYPYVIGEAQRSMTALFRIQKKSDIEKSHCLFGTQAGYNDEYQYKKMMNRLGFRSGYAYDLWCNHIGFAIENRGFPKGFINYAGYGEGRNTKRIKQGYSEIDLKTNKPLKE